MIGYGVIQDSITLETILETLNNRAEVLDINLGQSRIEIVAKNIDDSIVNELHQKLITA